VYKSYADCPTDSTTEGKVQATIVGIEYRENCTYLLIDNDYIPSFTDHDSSRFESGRFTYLAIDPSNQESYKVMLTLATTALATQIRVTSRLARVDRLSLSKQSNKIP